MGLLRRMLKENGIIMNKTARVILLIGAVALILIGLDVLIEPTAVFLDNVMQENLAGVGLILVGLLNLVTFRRKSFEKTSVLLLGAFGFVMFFRIAQIGLNPFAWVVNLTLVAMVVAARVLLHHLTPPD